MADKDLRWAVGCILAEGDQTPDDSLLKTLQRQGYKTIKLPEVDRVTMTLFPYKNRVSMFLAIYRVWSAIGAYIKVGIQAPKYNDLPWTNQHLRFTLLTRYVKFYFICDFVLRSVLIPNTDYRDRK